MSGDDEQYDERDFLCYFLLRELESVQPAGRSVTRTQFLKLSCIADRLLSEEYDVDIGMPRYWYQYGEILNEGPINNSYYNVTPGEWGGRKVQPAPGISRNSFDVPTEYIQPVRTVIRRVANEFANEDSEDIKSYQYENHVPNNFIQSFDTFREYIINQGQQSTTLAEFAAGSLQPPEEQAKEFLDEMMAEYPVCMYSDMYDLYLRWDDTVRLLLDEGDFEGVEDLLEDFWETFSKVELRLHHEQNTPQEQEVRWLNEQDEEMAGFSDRLTEIREKILAEREPSGALGSITESETSEDLI